MKPYQTTGRQEPAATAKNTKIKGLRRTLRLAVFALLAALLPSVAFAAEDEVASAVGSLISIMLPLFRGAGVVLLAYGTGQLVLAMKDEATEPKVRAITLVIVAVCLVTIDSLLDGLLTTLGSPDVF